MQVMTLVAINELRKTLEHLTNNGTKPIIYLAGWEEEQSEFPFATVVSKYNRQYLISGSLGSDVVFIQYNRLLESEVFLSKEDFLFVVGTPTGLNELTKEDLLAVEVASFFQTATLFFIGKNIPEREYTARLKIDNVSEAALELLEALKEKGFVDDGSIVPELKKVAMEPIGPNDAAYEVVLAEFSDDNKEFSEIIRMLNLRQVSDGVNTYFSNKKQD